MYTCKKGAKKTIPLQKVYNVERRQIPDLNSICFTVTNRNQPKTLKYNVSISLSTRPVEWVRIFRGSECKKAATESAVGCFFCLINDQLYLVF